MSSPISREVSKHLDHIEDVVFTDPTKWLDLLDDIRYLCLELIHGRGSAIVSVKWDGAPAVVAGRDAEGRKFVGTKSVFNQGLSNKLYSVDEINKSCAPVRIRGALATVLDAIHQIAPGDMIWGDLLFTEPPGGQFHPNVIEYTPHDAIDPFATVGIAWHSYVNSGNTSHLTSNVSKLFFPTIWSPSTTVGHLNDKTINDLYQLVGVVGPLKKTSCDVSATEHQQCVTDWLKQYVNKCVRSGIDPFGDAAGDKIPAWVLWKGQQESSSKKTLVAKQRWINFAQSIVDHIVPTLDFRISAAQFVTVAKQLLIKSISSSLAGDRFDTNVINSEGKKIPCGHEGFVYRAPSGATYKLVNRPEFSKNNFDAEQGLIVRGW